MPKIWYRDFNFSDKTLATIDNANEIIDAYRKEGYDLTLRQLYYQFVSRDLIANKQSEYNRLGSIINDGRLAGLIDWSAIVDRTRNLSALGHWASPSDLISQDAAYYQLDRWDDQPTRVEVWIEKEALAGVFERACRKYDVPFFSCRGYTSQSEMWSAAMRLQEYESNGQDTTILHFGDHDPSGIDMTRDIQDRLRLFGTETQIHRIALNHDQVLQYNPPPNPAKITDSRAAAYIAAYGRSSWELDALPPTVLGNLVEREIKDIMNLDLYNAKIAKLKKDKELLTKVSDNWDNVVEMLENR